MIEIAIDANVCKKCGSCARACPRAILQQEEKGTVPEVVALERCFGCGHCVAACPTGAILHSEYPEGTVHPIKAEILPDYDQVLELVRSRRSRRRYKDAPVERDVIEKVLDAARFAPSEHNVQDTEYVVVQDKETIH